MKIKRHICVLALLAFCACSGNDNGNAQQQQITVSADELYKLAEKIADEKIAEKQSVENNSITTEVPNVNPQVKKSEEKGLAERLVGCWTRREGIYNRIKYWNADGTVEVYADVPQEDLGRVFIILKGVYSVKDSILNETWTESECWLYTEETGTVGKDHVGLSGEDRKFISEFEKSFLSSNPSQGTIKSISNDVLVIFNGNQTKVSVKEDFSGFNKHFMALVQTDQGAKKKGY